ncbi:tRNA preQ1(34) S-adenosylmethionine ribosyltransferase-isomerase QueA [Amphibiibacter pelophylacis]|uniref:tRNA preQ1(34) S-adenosylmethionine ribosyltransferase-isomerase QueA n=1 Tax=Amphibiibacter pelophylacis TaxID=1799477 RepID=A0ACC6P5T9_9BURK
MRDIPDDAQTPDLNRLSSYDYDLPPELIAQQPTAQRSASRLLDGSGAAPVDRHFTDLPSLLRAGDVLVMNDTRVLRARLHGRKSSGGRIEALVERVLPASDGVAREVWAHVRASKSPTAGSVIHLGLDDADAAEGTGFAAQVLGRCGPDNGLFHLRFDTRSGDAYALLERHGYLPLPPYISRADDAQDAERYQSVMARTPGAVAAPTASLHFDEALLQRIREQGVPIATVTLHVGAGTFQPVRHDDVRQHTMHSEWLEIPPATVAAIAAARQAGGRIVAVGTTSVRALESMADADGTLHAGQRDTDIFITPGYRWRVVDALITNFHLPKSTLLMLVSALAGYGRIRQLYAHAVAQGYRFFSYGDAMWLERPPEVPPQTSAAD